MKRAIRALYFLAASSVAPLGGAGCNTTTPAPVTRADSADIEVLKAKLAKDGRFSRLKKVTVDPTSGVLTLSGQVPSESARAVAVIYNELQPETPTR